MKVQKLNEKTKKAIRAARKAALSQTVNHETSCNRLIIPSVRVSVAFDYSRRSPSLLSYSYKFSLSAHFLATSRLSKDGQGKHQTRAVIGSLCLRCIHTLANHSMLCPGNPKKRK